MNDICKLSRQEFIDSSSFLTALVGQDHLSERLVFVTPDLQRKSTPEGFRVPMWYKRAAMKLLVK